MFQNTIWHFYHLGFLPFREAFIYCIALNYLCAKVSLLIDFLPYLF